MRQMGINRVEDRIGDRRTGGTASGTHRPEITWGDICRHSKGCATKMRYLYCQEIDKIQNDPEITRHFTYYDKYGHMQSFPPCIKVVYRRDNWNQIKTAVESKYVGAWFSQPLERDQKKMILNGDLWELTLSDTVKQPDLISLKFSRTKLLSKIWKRCIMKLQPVYASFPVLN
jgi:hypothetical protein